MKIAHVVGSLDPDMGGPPLFVPRLAVAVARLGHEVSIYSHEPPHRSDAIDAFLNMNPGNELLNVRRLHYRGRIDRLRGHALVDAIRRELADADIMHLHGIWEPVLLRAAAAARRLGVPYVISAHGMLDTYSMAQKKLKKQLAMALAYKRMLNGAVGIHALNVDEAELMKPLHLRPAPFVAALGLNADELLPLPEPGGFRATLPALGERKYFLFLSRIHQKKGLDLLAEAFTRFDAAGGDWDLVIAGPDGGAQADFEQRIAAHGLSGRVHLPGSMWGEPKRQALADADGFILPSRQEGFSQAITEAMLCGLPVVITENCHFPEVAEVGAGLVTKLDIDEIFRAMLAVATDADAARRMGEAGKHLVLERYTWPKVAGQMIDAYRRAIPQLKAAS